MAQVDSNHLLDESPQTTESPLYESILQQEHDVSTFMEPVDSLMADAPEADTLTPQVDSDLGDSSQNSQILQYENIVQQDPEPSASLRLVDMLMVDAPEASPPVTQASSDYLLENPSQTAQPSLYKSVLQRDHGDSATPEQVDTSMDDVPSASTPIDNGQTPEPGPLRDFHCFSKLPVELRLQIYSHALPAPRIIEIMWDEDRGYFTDCSDKVPQILHICSESRLFALEIYIPMFVENETGDTIDDDAEDSENATSSTSADQSTTLQPLRMYINPSTDTLYLSMGNWHRKNPYSGLMVNFLKALDPNVSSKLEHLCTSYYFAHILLSQVNMDGGHFLPLIAKFPKLKTFEMAISDICMSLFGNDARNMAPRRPALGTRTIDVSRDFESYRWSPVFQGVSSTLKGLPFRKANADKIALWKQLLVGKGVDANFVDALEFTVTEIIRGEVVS